tara:strand:- start:142 stop:366 length:225 start_codon:yes stop_codon:yes gene_type:complete
MQLKKQNKKRLYSPDEEALEVIKDELKKQGFKSNNSQAVNQAVIFLKKAILKKREIEDNANKQVKTLKQQITKL